MTAALSLGVWIAMAALLCFGGAGIFSQLVDRKIEILLIHAGSFLSTVYAVTVIVIVLAHVYR